MQAEGEDIATTQHTVSTSEPQLSKRKLRFHLFH
jgi:hypothetical protein